MSIALGLASVVALSRWMDARRAPLDVRYEEEQLYMTGAAAKRLSLGFNGLVADWYWMRSLQYVGRKMLNYQGRVELDDLSPLNLRVLSALLDTTVTLDPQFMAAYEYGAVVLPSISQEQAIKLLEKGIAANPQSWKLRHHLGYIYWQRGDYQRASEIYAAGAKLAGAPSWMQIMSARMAAEGGTRSTAREIYTRMYEQSDDQQVREIALLRLMQVASFDERDTIRAALAEFKRRSGRCPSNWGELGPMLRATRLRLNASGAPLDPADKPYLLVQNGCDVDLDPYSKVPYK
ncbi:MAG TPA: hypothetical protein VGB17_09045 [Pyrinomonadaceae bacterium]